MHDEAETLYPPYDKFLMSKFIKPIVANELCILLKKDNLGDVEEQLLIIPICLPGYKPEDSAFIESYQFMFGYNNDILQWNQEYSSYVSQMPQLFGLSEALAGGMGIQNENQPGVVSYVFATGQAFDWSETAVLTYLVFVVNGEMKPEANWIIIAMIDKN